jgi:hypothetical protein
MAQVMQALLPVMQRPFCGCCHPPVCPTATTKLTSLRTTERCQCQR